MQGLLKLSSLIDGINEGIGKAATWLVLVVVVISAGNAIIALQRQLEFQRAAGNPVVPVLGDLPASARPMC